MNEVIKALHARALKVSGSYLSYEGELIDILQELDRTKGFLHYDSSSLFEYCQKHLKLSEGTASNLIAISRKAKEIPALKVAVQSRTIDVSKARRLTSVMTKANQNEWLEFAQNNSCRNIEKAVACAKPQLAVKETVKYKAKDRIERVVGISEELNEKLQKVIDLESQRTQKPASFEDTLEAMVELYLERKDPVRRAERAQKKTELHGTCHVKTERAGTDRIRICKRTKLPATLIHAVTMRDQRRCTHVDTQGQRCLNTRWLDVHHILPLYRGGKDELDNLKTLCSSHHRFEHLDVAKQKWARPDM